MVYFIQSGSGGPIKIGFANNARSRLRSMQTGNPKQLYIRLIVDGGFIEEKRYQEMFKEDNIRGEWFNPTKKLMGLISSYFENGAVSEVPFNVPHGLCSSLVGKIGLGEIIERIERQFVKEALRMSKGNKSEAARRLNITRKTLNSKLLQDGIESA